MAGLGSENGAYRWRLVALLFTIACLNYADRTAISSVLPLLRAELGMSDVALGAIGSFFLWSYAAGSPFAGILADRVSRSRLIVFSLAAWSLVTAATGLVQSAGQLLGMRTLLGLAECAYLPASIALIADYHRSTTRATAMSIHVAGLNFGLVAGGVLAGYVGDHFGWRPSFLVLGCTGLLLAYAAHRLLRDAPELGEDAAREGDVKKPSLPPLQAIAELARIPSYWILLMEAMLISIGVWMFFQWLPLYFQETFHMSLTGAGFSGTFLLQIAATVGTLAGGYFSDRAARGGAARRMLLQSLCYFAATPFLLVFFGKPQFVLLNICVFGYSLFKTLGAANENAVVCDLLAARLRATGIGLMNTLNTLAGGAGILIAGYMKAGSGLGGIFASVSIIALLAASLTMAGYLFFLPRDLARQRAAEASPLLGAAVL